MISDKDRAVRIAEELRRRYPDADCTLEYETPWQLLIAAILAAQCTDARVNIITENLFSKFKDLLSFASVSQEELENDIRSCGLFRNKAKAIRESSQMLLSEFDGRMPDTLEQLVRLPGVGRKIANLILGDGFGKPAVVVDTHCARITALLGLTESKNPVVVERDLVSLLPETLWISWGHLMVSHGRDLCKATSRQCIICPVNNMCKWWTDGSGMPAAEGSSK